MALQWVADDTPVIALELPEPDGLLDYLHTLFRVAHAASASHWCTPGHNRGQVQAAGAFTAPSFISLPLPPHEEGR